MVVVRLKPVMVNVDVVVMEDAKSVMVAEPMAHHQLVVLLTELTAIVIVAEVLASLLLLLLLVRSVSSVMFVVTMMMTIRRRRRRPSCVVAMELALVWVKFVETTIMVHVNLDGCCYGCRLGFPVNLWPHSWTELTTTTAAIVNDALVTEPSVMMMMMMMTEQW